jgi:2-keto-3-deoxy-L-rhamnonate aldolase RhmA
MKRSSVTLRMAGFAVVAGMMAGAVSAMAQRASQPPPMTNCPASGCDIPGITVPNGKTTCGEAGGAGVRDSTFNPKTGLCNTGPIDPATWVYGPRHDLTPQQKSAPLYNPVKARMAQRLPVLGARWGAPDGSDYCSVAKYDEARNHFTWADEAHAALDNSTLYAKWQNYCPGLNYDTTAARGAAGNWADEREAQRDSDGGAIVLIRPVNSVRDAQEAIFWNYWPPFGHRSAGGSQVYDGKIKETKNAPYRDSYNQNLVMIAQITTVAGARAVADIARLDGIHALFLDEDNLRLQSTGVADYNQLANAVRAAAKSHNKYLCTVDRKATPQVMACNP